MIYTTEQFVAFDECDRKLVWQGKFETLRVTLAVALYKALAEGLKSGLPEKASERLLKIAGNPGLAIVGHNVYEIARHHAALMELITTYLLTTAGESSGSLRWKRADTVSIGAHSYRPQSYHLRDGRLRRIVLCSTWSEARELEERNSWRSIGDVVATGRPMTVNAIVIGNHKSGFRPSVWTAGYEHPKMRGLRVKLRDRDGYATPFSDDWRKVYREGTSMDPLAWLKLMQDDGAFEAVVKTMHIETPANTSEIRDQMEWMLQEMTTASVDRPRRASCYRAFSPCPFAPACTSGQSPLNLGFRPK